jgi:hypothetical protein
MHGEPWGRSVEEPGRLLLVRRALMLYLFGTITKDKAQSLISGIAAGETTVVLCSERWGLLRRHGHLRCDH